MIKTLIKSKKSSNVRILNTHDIGISLPMNTKYLSGNPVSRWLIRRFVKTLIALISSIDTLDDTLAEKILDVGCGEGLIPRQVKYLLPFSLFHGVDIDPDLLKVAMHLVPDMGCVAGSVYSLPFADNSYDLVCCTEVLEHLENPGQAISEIARVGEDYLIFSVPNEPFWRIANIVRGAYWPEWGNSPGHVNHWHSCKFAHLLSRYLDVIEVKQSFPWTIALCRKQ